MRAPGGSADSPLHLASVGGSADSPLRLASVALLPKNLGFDERFVTFHSPASVTVLDGMGGETQREVSVNQLKNRFFQLGLQTGFALQMFTMAVVMMFACYHGVGAIEELSRVYYTIFRGLFLVCFFFSCYGCDLYVWKRCNVNYRALLGVAHNHNYHSVVRASCSLMTLVFFSFVLYVLTLTMQLTPNKHVWPLTALFGMIGALLWPWDWMPEWKDRSQRVLMLKTLLRVLASPLTRVTFARTFVADVLTSMPKIFTDLLFTACMLATRNAFEVHWDARANALVGGDQRCTDGDGGYHVAHAAMQLLPFWVRLMQCCRAYFDTRQPRHGWNALKYCTSMAVIFLSLLSSSNTQWYTAWAIVSAVSSVYAYIWDIVMDWVRTAYALPSPTAHCPLCHAPMTGPRVGRGCGRGCCRAVYTRPSDRSCTHHGVTMPQVARMAWRG